MFSSGHYSASKKLYTLCVITLFFTRCVCSDDKSTKPTNNLNLPKDTNKPIIIYPKVRSKRSLTDFSTEKLRNNKHDLQIQFNHESEEFAIYLRKNEHLVTSGTLVEWHYPNGTKQLSKLNGIVNHNKEGDKKKKYRNEDQNPDDCLFIGEVIGGPGGRINRAHHGGVKSIAAIDVCDGGYRGYLQIGKDGYIIRPLKEHEVFLQYKNIKEKSSLDHVEEYDKTQSAAGENLKDFKR